MSPTIEILGTPRQRAAAPVWSLPEGVTTAKAGAIAASFLDVAATSFGRSTHHNTREEQQRAELGVHEALLSLDRDLYALFLRVPGVTDRARQVGIKNLLGSARGQRRGLIDDVMERRILAELVAELPAARVFKLFEALRVGSAGEGIRKANNARTRKLILRTILASDRLALWAVKYRAKMRAALTHAWGQRTAGALRSILAREDALWTAKERSIVREHIDRFGPPDVAKVHACVGFVLGNENRTSVPLIEAFTAAKRDLSAGARLPPEVLEGIRSVFHKDTAKEEVLRITAGSMTKAQRMLVQKRAAAADVDVKMDPADYDAVRLYVYVFEMGMTEAIARALVAKGREASRGFPVRYASLGILVDASASMFGSAEQKLRPMATTLAVRDMLQHVGRASVVVCGGAASAADWMTIRPCGDTSLAEGLIDLVAEGPEVIFVLSDGYENRPRGRFAEVVAGLRSIGIATPIIHLSPVFAAEAGGVRELAPGLVPTLPVERPAGLGLSFLRGLLEADPVRGIEALVRLTLPEARDGEALKNTPVCPAVTGHATPVGGGVP
jgi:hypothetical protein